MIRLKEGRDKAEEKMINNHLDANNNPIRSGFYKDRRWDRGIFFIDLENDFYEVINPMLAFVRRSGKVSERVEHYFNRASPVDIQKFIDYHEQHVDFFRSRSERIRKPQSPS